jgi:hypothetical protein
MSIYQFRSGAVVVISRPGGQKTYLCLTHAWGAGGGRKVIYATGQNAIKKRTVSTRIHPTWNYRLCKNCKKYFARRQGVLPYVCLAESF